VGAVAITLGGAAALVGDEPLNVDALALESVYPDIRRATVNRFAFFLGRFGEWLADATLAHGRARHASYPVRRRSLASTDEPRHAALSMRFAR
jgi:hypothetical protein